MHEQSRPFRGPVFNIGVYMSDDALKAELIKKCHAAGIWRAKENWSVETLERKLSEAALEDQDLPSPDAEQPEGTFRCRVTKRGRGKISTGLENPIYFDWDQWIFLAPATAEQLEDRGFVEIYDQ